MFSYYGWFGRALKLCQVILGDFRMPKILGWGHWVDHVKVGGISLVFFLTVATLFLIEPDFVLTKSRTRSVKSMTIILISKPIENLPLEKCSAVQKV